MRRQMSSTSDTCSEDADEDVAGIRGRMGVYHPGRSGVCHSMTSGNAEELGHSAAMADDRGAIPESRCVVRMWSQ